MEYQHYETLRFDYEGRVLTVTIDAPGPVNAVNDHLHHDLSRVFSDLQGDPDCDIIVLTGSGRAFCALPLKEIAHKVMDAALAYETLTNLTEDRQEAVRAFVEKRKPDFKGE